MKEKKKSIKSKMKAGDSINESVKISDMKYSLNTDYKSRVINDLITKFPNAKKYLTETKKWLLESGDVYNALTDDEKELPEYKEESKKIIDKYNEFKDYINQLNSSESAIEGFSNNSLEKVKTEDPNISKLNDANEIFKVIINKFKQTNGWNLTDTSWTINNINIDTTPESRQGFCEGLRLDFSDGLSNIGEVYLTGYSGGSMIKRRLKK
jgi:hypothetical protein